MSGRSCTRGFICSMRLIVTGGGTGGHLFPGIAVGLGMQKRIPGTKVMFIGTDRQMDRETLLEHNFEPVALRCSGLKGVGMMSKLTSLIRMPLAVIRAIGILSRFKPDLVFGVGGYVTGPVVLAAKMLRIPICIHEQNSVPGMANRLAGKLADRICISIPCSPPFNPAKTVLTGNPVREGILAIATQRQQEKDKVLTLAVLGGSQGAHRVNVLMVEALQKMKFQGIEPRVIHQTGSADEQMVVDAYDEAGIVAEVRSFFKSMEKVYLESDLIVSRAGATTLAEMAVLGIPALLIPFPYAADNHQQTNGEYYVGGKGCRLFQESQLAADILAEKVSDLLQNRKELHTMAASMKTMGVPEATGRIVAECVNLVKKG